MVNVKHTFKYQPNPTSSFILWSWTICILCLAIIWFLETVTFTWTATALLVVFILLVLIQWQMRRVTVDRNLIIFSSVVNRQWLVIPRDQLQGITLIKHGVQLKVANREYHFLMFKKARLGLVKLLTN